MKCQVNKYNNIVNFLNASKSYNLHVKNFKEKVNKISEKKLKTYCKLKFAILCKILYNIGNNVYI